MQFKEKPVNKTWQNNKKSNFGPDFGLFDTNFGPKNFFRGFCLYWILEIVASYHRIQLKKKIKMQTQ